MILPIVTTLTYPEVFKFKNKMKLRIINAIHLNIQFVDFKLIFNFLFLFSFFSYIYYSVNYHLNSFTVFYHQNEICIRQNSERAHVRSYQKWFNFPFSISESIGKFFYFFSTDLISSCYFEWTTKWTNINRWNK